MPVTHISSSVRAPQLRSFGVTLAPFSTGWFSAVLSKVHDTETWSPGLMVTGVFSAYASCQ